VKAPVQNHTNTVVKDFESILIYIEYHTSYYPCIGTLVLVCNSLCDTFQFLDTINCSKIRLKSILTIRCCRKYPAGDQGSRYSRCWEVCCSEHIQLPYRQTLELIRSHNSVFNFPGVIKHMPSHPTNKIGWWPYDSTTRAFLWQISIYCNFKCV